MSEVPSAHQWAADSSCSKQVIVIADQSFPAVLPVSGQEGCLKIILVENGSLDSRGSRFLCYNILQFAIDRKNNSKTKVQKAFFFIFMSSHAEMSF
jgi:hypothetical protein